MVLSEIGGASGHADWENLEMYLEVFVAGKPISHHQWHSVWLGEAGGRT